MLAMGANLQWVSITNRSKENDNIPDIRTMQLSLPERGYRRSGKEPALLGPSGTRPERAMEIEPGCVEDRVKKRIVWWEKRLDEMAQRAF